MIPRAYTLIELLLTVALIGVLISLLAPSLGGARRAARDAVSLSNLRGHAQVIAAYASDFQDQFPFLADPSAPATVIRLASGESVTINQYFAVNLFWNYAMADAYYGGNPRQASFYAPGYPAGVRDGDRTGPSTYQYPCVFSAHPEYWSPWARRYDRSQLRSTRQADVLFPDRKSLLVSDYPLQIEMPQPFSKRPGYFEAIGWADGSAAHVPLPEISDGYFSADGPAELGIHLNDLFPWGLHAINGVRGRDR